MLGVVLSLLVTAALPAARAEVDAVEIVVRNLRVERSFYIEALRFRDAGKRAIEGGHAERLSLGAEHVDLIEYGRRGKPIPSDARSNDRTFQHLAIIVSDMNRAWAHVRRFGIARVSTSPQVLPRWNPNAGGIAAVYFRDPEGHPLELLHFPSGKGAPQWHAASPLFLGIDHTAIAVADTAASTRFYEALGMTVRGHSDNYGIEQERLSGVRHAHVAITAIRFATAPGIEFLQYVTPRRPQPPEAASIYDVLGTRTLVVTPKSGALCASLPPVVRLADGCIVRDPDGHLLELHAREPIPEG